MDRTNKSRVGGANIEVGKKADVGAIVSINNNTDSYGKVIDWLAGLANLAFTVFAAAHCAGNSNFTILEEITLGIATSISDKFTFPALANITFEKKLNVCECNLF